MRTGLPVKAPVSPFTSAPYRLKCALYISLLRDHFFLLIFLLFPGGSLKTVAEADQESLQASWWDRQAPLQLRGRDILRLIDCGLKYDL